MGEHHHKGLWITQSSHEPQNGVVVFACPAAFRRVKNYYFLPLEALQLHVDHMGHKPQQLLSCVESLTFLFARSVGWVG